MSLTEIPVEFTSDEKGYYDRQCPNEKYEYVFKIYMEDWKEKVSDEQVFCPMSHKKVYRLCKELKILKDQRVIKPAVKSKISVNRIVKKSNALWEADIKYGYITGEDKFFFVLSVIDVLDRSIIDYYMGYSCTGSDAASLIKRCLLKRNLFNSKDKPVIRTDNGPQFISHIFEDSCVEVGVYHERIPSRTPNKNAHIESFHRILQDECIGVYLISP